MWSMSFLAPGIFVYICKMKKLTALLFAAVCLCSTTRAADPETAGQIDSLRGRLPGLSADRIFDTYVDLTCLYEEAGDNDACIALLDEFMAAVKSSPDKGHFAYALNSKLNFYYNTNNDAEFHKTLPVLLDYCRRHEQWYYYAAGISLAATNLAVKGEGDRALGMLREMYDLGRERGNALLTASALYGMGRIYHSPDQLDMAENAYREAIGLLRGSSDPHEMSLLGNIYRDLGQTLRSAEKYGEALEICRQWEELLSRKSKADGGPIDVYDLFGLNIGYAKSLASLDRPAEAASHLATAAATSLARTEIGRALILSVQWKISEAGGRYGEALTTLDSLYAYYARTGQESSKYGTVRSKGRIAQLAGRYEVAADAFREANVLGDSLSGARSKDELHRLRTEYEVDKLEAQKQARENYLWLAGGIIALLAGLLAVWMVYARRVRRKNLALYQQIREMLQKDKQAEQALSAVPEEELSRGMQLFRRVGEWMRTEKPFTNPDLNRKTLSERLGTNETYVADAIREATGGTVQAYITGLRLQYSLELLGGDPTLTFDTVAVDSGYGSYSAFFKAFTRQYGISPSEYRRLSMAKEEMNA